MRRRLVQMTLRSTDCCVWLEQLTAVAVGPQVHVAFASSPAGRPAARVRQALRANLRPFVALGVSGAMLRVKLGDLEVGHSDRDGFAVVRREQHLAPGAGRRCRDAAELAPARRCPSTCTSCRRNRESAS